MRIEDNKKKKALIVRLAKIEGQLRGVALMIKKEEDCKEIAAQLSASRSALSGLVGAFTLCAFEEAEHPYSSSRSDTIAQIVKIIS